MIQRMGALVTVTITGQRMGTVGCIISGLQVSLNFSAYYSLFSLPCCFGLKRLEHCALGNIEGILLTPRFGATGRVTVGNTGVFFSDGSRKTGYKCFDTKVFGS